VQPSIDVVQHPPMFGDPFAQRPKLMEQLQASPPVVVAGAVQYLQLWYYAPADLRPRLWYIADPVRALKYKGGDTPDRGYVTLARWAPIGIRGYEQLTAQQGFTLYDDGSGWLPAQLHDSGAVMTALLAERGAHVSHVVVAGGR